MPIIIWGKKIRTEPRGIVAEKCSVCGDTERFAVTDYYEVEHIYYIAIGRGTRVDCTSECARCRSQFRIAPDNYDDYLPPADADMLSLDEIVDRTNPRLAYSRDMRRGLETMAREQPSRAPGDTATGVTVPGTPVREVPLPMQDAELREAIGRLEPYEGTGQEVAKLMRRLQSWPILDAASRAGLLQEVNAFIETQQKTTRAVSFFNSMAAALPPRLGCLPATLLAGIFISGFFLTRITYWHAYYSVGYAVIGILAVLATNLIVNAVLLRRWMRRTFVAKAIREKIDASTLVTVMANAAHSPDRIDDKVRALASEWPYVKRAMAARRDGEGM